MDLDFRLLFVVFILYLLILFILACSTIINGKIENLEQSVLELRAQLDNEKKARTAAESEVSKLKSELKWTKESKKSKSSANGEETITLKKHTQELRSLNTTKDKDAAKMDDDELITVKTPNGVTIVISRESVSLATKGGFSIQQGSLRPDDTAVGMRGRTTLSSSRTSSDHTYDLLDEVPKMQRRRTF